MKKADIKKGGLYQAKVGGNLTVVRVDEITPGGIGEYRVTNLATKRTTYFRSAAKFRGVATPADFRENNKRTGRKVGQDEIDRVNVAAIGTTINPITALPAREISDAATTLAKSDAEISDTGGTDEGGNGQHSAGGRTEGQPAAATAGGVVEAPAPGGTGLATDSCRDSWTARCSQPGFHLAGILRAHPDAPAAAQSVRVGHPPTEEQRATIEASKQLQTERGCKVLVIEAGAGCGKTSDLAMMAEVLRGQGQYTAFNTALVADSKRKFPVSVACNTTHSLAFRAEGKRFVHRLGGRRIRSEQVAKMLGIEELVLPFGTDEKTGQPRQKRLASGLLAGQVIGAIRRFCQSADREVSGNHFRYIDGIDLPKDGERTYANNEQVRDYLLPFARKAWIDLSNPEGSLPYSHDFYVKTWQLGNPVIAADYILLDEDQDSAEVLLDVLKQQVAKGTPLILVGDENQCQPTGTLITVVRHYRRGNHFTGFVPTRYKQTPIEEIKIGDNVASYDIAHSFFRRSGSKVSGISTRDFSGNLIRATVPSGESSVFTPEHRCVVRVGDALNNKWVIYLMKRGWSFRIGMVKGMYETALGNLGLPMRMRAEGAEAAWVLSVHVSESLARLTEATLSWRYGIPSLRFKQGTDHGITQEELDEFWDMVDDLTPQAESILEDYGRSISHPFCEPDRSVYRNRGQLMQACNLIDGMLMLTMVGAMDAKGKRAVKNLWSPIKIEQEFYEGPVYSLAVGGDETYISDGIVTHNSIYQWRGCVNAAAAFPDAPRLLLSQSFRFGPAIAEVANAVLKSLREPTALQLKGLPSISSRVIASAQDENQLENPACILCRTNAAAVANFLAAIAAGRKPFLVGGGSDVISFVEGAQQLMAGQSTSHSDLACFGSWSEVQQYVKEDENGDDLKLMVKLIDEFGADEILKGLRQMPTEQDADLTISTSHKSKGKEWDTVRLASDFPTQSKCEDADRRLLYVACTRAKLVLDVSYCPFFTGQDSLDITAATSIQPTAALPVREGLVPPTPAAKPASQFSWSKNGEAWMIRGPAGHQPGEQVTVTRRNGSESKERLGSPVWEKDGVALYRNYR